MLDFVDDFNPLRFFVFIPVEPWCFSYEEIIQLLVNCSNDRTLSLVSKYIFESEPSNTTCESLLLSQTCLDTEH